jgi:plasmid stability protein
VPTLTLKNLPASLHRRLKVRARANRRSLNAEAIACLQAAVAAERVDVDAFLARARLLRARVKGTLTDEDLARLKAEGRP